VSERDLPNVPVETLKLISNLHHIVTYCDSHILAQVTEKCPIIEFLLRLLAHEDVTVQSNVIDSLLDLTMRIRLLRL
jgi:hypothetical protein